MKDNQENKQKNLNQALLEINRGFSVLNAEGRDFYFRHFTLSDILLLDEEYDLAVKKARKSGIKTEKELIDQAIKRGFWSLKKEEEAKSLEWTKKKLIEAKNKTQDPSQKILIEKSVEEKENQLKSIGFERKKITEVCAENFAENKRMGALLKLCCFLDRGLSEPVPHDSSFFYFVPCMEKISQYNERNFILNVAYNTQFFELFCLHYRQPHVVFGKSGFDLTAFQKNLLVYSNSLLNKLKNVSVPDSLLSDPIRILEYDEKREKGNKKSEGVGDLKEKMKNRGGVLKPEDFIT